MGIPSSVGRTLAAISRQNTYGNQPEYGSIALDIISCQERSRPFLIRGDACTLPAENLMCWPITRRGTRMRCAGLVVRRVRQRRWLKICRSWVSERRFTILTWTLLAPRQPRSWRIFYTVGVSVFAYFSYLGNWVQKVILIASGNIVVLTKRFFNSACLNYPE